MTINVTYVSEYGPATATFDTVSGALAFALTKGETVVMQTVLAIAAHHEGGAQ